MSRRMLLSFYRSRFRQVTCCFASDADPSAAADSPLPLRRMKNYLALFLALAGLILVGYGLLTMLYRDLPPVPVAVPPPDPINEEVYTFGVVPQFDTRQLASVWQPLLKQVEMRAGCRLQYKASKNIPSFEVEFEEGHFDFAYMNPYHSTVAYNKQGYTPLVRDHSRQLYGIIVVRADSELQDVKDLNGTTITFPSPNALGASLLMRAELHKQHQLDFRTEYTQKHDSVYLNVLSGKYVAGGGVKSTLNQQEMRESLRVIYETRKLAPHPIVSHPRVPADVAARVQKAFYDLADAPCCKQLLASVPMKSPGPATRQDYEELDALGLEEFYVRPN